MCTAARVGTIPGAKGETFNEVALTINNFCRRKSERTVRIELATFTTIV